MQWNLPFKNWLSKISSFFGIFYTPLPYIFYTTTLYRSIIYNIYTWFVGSKHSHWLMVVCNILLWQITECALVGRWSFSVMISKLWHFAWVWLSQQLLVCNLSWLDALWVGWLSTCWKRSRHVGWMWSGQAGSRLARYDLDWLALW
jgi:hypothetical protein